MIKRSVILLIIVIAWQSMFSQTNLDSLFVVWKDESQTDIARIEAIYICTRDGCVYSHPDSAFELAEDMIEFSIEKSNRKGVAMGLSLQALSYYLKGQYSHAYQYFQDALKIQEEINDLEGMSTSYNGLGRVYEQRGDYTSALDYFRLSLSISKSNGYQMIVGNSLNNIGRVYYSQGSDHQALKYYQQSLAIREEIGDQIGIAGSLVNIGNIHRNQKDYNMALDYYQRSLKFWEEISDKQGIAVTLNNIGHVHKDQLNYEKALEYHQQSLEISEEMGDQNGVSSSLADIGNIYMAQGDYEKSLDHQKRSLNIREEIGDQKGISNSLADIGHNYCKLGNFSVAQEYCSRGLHIAESIGALIEQKNNCDCLYKTFKASGESNEALAYLERINSIEDSLFAKETVKLLQKIEFEKEITRDSIARVDEARNIEEAHKAEMRKNNRIRNVLLSSGLIVLMLAGGLWSRIRYIRRANKQLATAKEKAEESEQIKKQFLANMSHEIRTPMNAVLGMTNLTLDTSLSKKQKNYLEAIKHSSENLLIIINDILDLSKLEAGKMELESIPFRINEQIDLVYDTLRFKAEEKGLNFSTSVNEDVPEYLIGDPARLMQVLINLGGNAIKFTEKGRVEIVVDLKEGTKSTLLFRVIDTGIGIQTNKFDILFNAFQQADTSIARKYGGTGLGLAISRTIVELQNGRLNFKSESGKGSEFFFTIPYEVANAEQIEEIRLKKQSDTSTLCGIKILLAEDNEYNSIVVNDTLENLISDVKIDHAVNGKIAVDLLADNQYDIVLMDVHMPEMDGLEATKYIRNNLNSSKKDIPIIALTASVLAADINKCLEAGMDDSIPKPFKRKELIETLMKYYHSNNSDSDCNEMGRESQSISETVDKDNKETITDLEFLNEFCEGDITRIKKYIKMYLMSVSQNVKKINTALSEKDTKALHIVIHSMKPHFNFMGMKETRSTADKIEELINSGHQMNEDLVNLVNTVLKDCDSSVNELI